MKLTIVKAEELPLAFPYFARNASNNLFYITGKNRNTGDWQGLMIGRKVITEFGDVTLTPLIKGTTIIIDE